MAKVKVYPVDKDVPIPDASRATVPIDTLEPGESILFPSEERNNVQSRASHLKRQKNKEFTIRMVDDSSCRVWRVK
jgi:hypothetical protein